MAVNVDRRTAEFSAYFAELVGLGRARRGGVLSGGDAVRDADRRRERRSGGAGWTG